MNVDDKLKTWREATSSIAPSAKVVAALEAGLAASAPVAASTGVGIALKVLIVTAIVGAMFYGASLGVWRWCFGSMPSTDAGTLTDFGCEPRPARPAIPPSYGNGVYEIRQEQFYERMREERAELERQLVTRPLTCLAQQAPLTQLASLDWKPPQFNRYRARIAILCGASAVYGDLFRSSTDEGCSNGDWCRKPECDLALEDCASLWAKGPAGGCIAAIGRQEVTRFACVRFLRGEGTEQAVRDLDSNAWCLEPTALAERDWLIAHHATKGGSP